MYKIKYGATNSFGAEITDTIRVYSYFKIDKEKASVELNGAKYSVADAFIRNINYNV